jgi:2Fe-2S iron-sulfur cluster binding domain
MDSVVLTVNGEQRHVTAPPEQSLLWVLRDYLQLTGAKYGCGEGQCGACTVLVGGKAVRSCVTPLSAVAGKEIVTIEGLADNGTLHAVQQAFLRELLQEHFDLRHAVPAELFVLEVDGVPGSILAVEDIHRPGIRVSGHEQEQQDRCWKLDPTNDLDVFGNPY